MNHPEWTKEDASYTEWEHNVRKYFFSWQWAKIRNKWDAFHQAYLAGNTVYEAMKAYKTKHSIKNF
jgi:hypothetical protein